MSKAKIIIADDHPIFRSGINIALKNMTFISKISEAANGEEVLKLLTHESYDLVLMDIKMSPLNGIEATEIISKRYPQTKVIALSMHDDEDCIIDIFKSGASGYLIKNADKEEIAKAIKEVLEGGQYFSREASKTLFEHLHKLKTSVYDVDEDPVQRERLKEITFLICHEFTNQEIAEAMFLSTRTIEGYKTKIFKATNTTNIIGLVKYAIENKILEDGELKRKFAKALNEKSKNK